MQNFVLVLLVLAMVLAGVILYDSNRFHKVTYELSSSKIDKDFHFLFLSDLHNKEYGKRNEKLLAAIDACSPDAILIGGDLLTAHPKESVKPAAQFVKTVAAKYPVYYANGNHEQRLKLYPEVYGDMAQEYETLLGQIGVDRLVNEERTDKEHGVRIVGFEIDRRFYKRFRKVAMPMGYPAEILPADNGERYTILMAHNPAYFPQYKQWGADLVLSGHVHGGVARLPLIGGVIGTDFRLFPKYDGGRFDEDGCTMIVSRGLGAHTIPLRLWNPAELVEVVIRKEESMKEA